MSDIFGQALSDHYYQQRPAKLWIYNKYGPKEEMPVEVYFREEGSMPDAETLALERCYGQVLDIGAGAGSHSLILQSRGVNVTAIDISAKAVEVMADRGVANAIEQDIFTYAGHRYDTLLLLMNGIGLCGNIPKFRLFLQRTKALLQPGGQLLFDSSDIAYLYEGQLPAEGYYGEVWYRYAYKGKKTDWFQWLYIDADTLITVANEEGWAVEILLRDDSDGYLARLMVQ